MLDRIQTVFVGTSLTDQGDRLVAQALRVARAAGARIHLVHAFPIPVHARWETAELDPALLEAERGLRSDELRDLAHRLGIGVQELAGLTAAPGRAADLLAAEAGDAGALIVVGAAERTGPLAGVLGGTALATARRARCPVLVLRHDRVWDPRRVLFAVDLSESSADVFEAGAAVARQICGARAPDGELLFVLSPEERARSFQFTNEQVERMVGDELHRFAEIHRPAWFGLSDRVAVGSAAAEVVRRATRADLVVAGTRGRNRLQRLLLGSVATEIVRDAPCSVLLVPPIAVAELAGQRRCEAAEAEWHRHFG